MSEFIKYLKANQHSPNCTRAEAFSMGQKSRQAEVDELQANLDRADEIATRENNRANKLQEDNTRTTILLGKTIVKKEALEASIEESLQKVVRIKESFNQGKIVNYVMFLDDLEEILRGERE